jgi:hypothetical protein
MQFVSEDSKLELRSSLDILFSAMHLMQITMCRSNTAII